MESIRVGDIQKYLTTKMLVHELFCLEIECDHFVCLGLEARKLFDDAQKLLNEITENKLLQARGIVGLFRAVSEGDDIILLSSNCDNKEIGRLHGIRQQV